MAFGDICVAIYFRSGNSDDVFVCQRNPNSGTSQYLTQLPLHCDQQPRVAYDTKTGGVLVLGRSSLTHRCLTAGPNGYIDHPPLPLRDVGTDVGVVIFEDRYHVFGTCQDGTIQWITSLDANSWAEQSFVLTDIGEAAAISTRTVTSTVAPIVLNGDLYVFYRNGTILQGLRFIPSSTSWVLIYAGDNGIPADSVPVPVADSEGGILVFFWESKSNAMVHIRVSVI